MWFGCQLCFTFLGRVVWCGRVGDVYRVDGAVWSFSGCGVGDVVWWSSGCGNVMGGGVCVWRVWCVVLKVCVCVVCGVCWEGYGSWGWVSF